LNFRIKGFSAFIRAENLNTMSLNNGFGFTNNNFAAPLYPTQGFIFRFGIRWWFVNWGPLNPPRGTLIMFCHCWSYDQQWKVSHEYTNCFFSKKNLFAPLSIGEGLGVRPFAIVGLMTNKKDKPRIHELFFWILIFAFWLFIHENMIIS
jgi:hypothetical protein